MLYLDVISQINQLPSELQDIIWKYYWTNYWKKNVLPNLAMLIETRIETRKYPNKSKYVCNPLLRYEVHNIPSSVKNTTFHSVRYKIEHTPFRTTGYNITYDSRTYYGKSYTIYSNIGLKSQFLRNCTLLRFSGKIIHKREHVELINKLWLHLRRNYLMDIDYNKVKPYMIDRINKYMSNLILQFVKKTNPSFDKLLEYTLKINPFLYYTGR